MKKILFEFCWYPSDSGGLGSGRSGGLARLGGMILGLIFFNCGAAESDADEVIHSVSAIHSLSAAQVAQGLSVDLRGVATYYDAEWGMMFFQDSTGAVYVNLADVRFSIKSGHAIRLRGVVGEGDKYPVVTHPVAEVLTDSFVIETLALSYDELEYRSNDSRFVRLQGLIRSTLDDYGHLCFELGIGTHEIRVIIPERTDESLRHSMEGRIVSVEGAQGAVYDSDGNRTMVQLFAPSLAAVDGINDQVGARAVEVAGSAFHLESSMDKIYRVRGTIARVTGPLVYIQDGTGIVLVDHSENPILETVGTEISVTGYLSLEDTRQQLRALEVRPTGNQRPLVPVSIGAGEILSDNLHSQLVTVEGTMVDLIETINGTSITLSAGSVVFFAMIEGESLVERLPRTGAILSVTGIGERHRPHPGDPEMFTVHLNTAADIKVVDLPQSRSLSQTIPPYFLGALFFAALVGLLYRFRGWCVRTAGTTHRPPEQGGSASGVGSVTYQ